MRPPEEEEAKMQLLPNETMAHGTKLDFRSDEKKTCFTRCMLHSIEYVGILVFALK